MVPRASKLWPDEDISILLRGLDHLVSKQPYLSSAKEGARKLRKVLKPSLEKRDKAGEDKWGDEKIYCTLQRFLRTACRTEFQNIGMMSFFQYGSILLDLDKLFTDPDISGRVSPNFTVLEVVEHLSSQGQPNSKHTSGTIDSAIVPRNNEGTKEDQCEPDTFVKSVSVPMAYGQEKASGDAESHETWPNSSVSSNPVNPRQAKRRHLEPMDGDLESVTKEPRLCANHKAAAFASGRSGSLGVQWKKPLLKIYNKTNDVPNTPNTDDGLEVAQSGQNELQARDPNPINTLSRVSSTTATAITRESCEMDKAQEYSKVQHSKVWPPVIAQLRQEEYVSDDLERIQPTLASLNDQRGKFESYWKSGEHYMRKESIHYGVTDSKMQCFLDGLYTDCDDLFFDLFETTEGLIVDSNSLTLKLICLLPGTAKLLLANDDSDIIARILKIGQLDGPEMKRVLAAFLVAHTVKSVLVDEVPIDIHKEESWLKTGLNKEEDGRLARTIFNATRTYKVAHIESSQFQEKSIKPCAVRIAESTSKALSPLLQDCLGVSDKEPWKAFCKGIQKILENCLLVRCRLNFGPDRHEFRFPKSGDWFDSSFMRTDSTVPREGNCSMVKLTVSPAILRRSPIEQSSLPWDQ